RNPFQGSRHRGERRRDHLLCDGPKHREPRSRERIPHPRRNMELKTYPWETEVAKLSPDRIAELPAKRGYRPEFLKWFSDQGWIGWSSFRGGRWCFPVHEGGRVVAAHQIPPTKGEPVS